MICPDCGMPLDTHIDYKDGIKIYSICLFCGYDSREDTPRNREIRKMVDEAFRKAL